MLVLSGPKDNRLIALFPNCMPDGAGGSGMPGPSFREAIAVAQAGSRSVCDLARWTEGKRRPGIGFVHAFVHETRRDGAETGETQQARDDLKP